MPNPLYFMKLQPYLQSNKGSTRLSMAGAVTNKKQHASGLPTQGGVFSLNPPSSMSVNSKEAGIISL